MKILVVDDEELIRKSIKLVLDKDYEIFEAETITESMALFDKVEPNLILLDIYLPGIDGMQGLMHFRQRSISIPIILISGHSSFKLAQQALRLGATDYLVKPFTSVELTQTVKAALDAVTPEEDVHLDIPLGYKVHLPLENLLEDKFLSSRHRSHFLAFAQNAISDKKRFFEIISLHELVKAVTLQFEALYLDKDIVREVMPEDGKALHLNCEMYLLGGALANLGFTCAQETKECKAPFVMSFEKSGEKLVITYNRVGASWPEDIVARFTHWHKDPAIAMDASTAMLILGEHAVQQNRGEFNINPSLIAPKPLLEITLPLVAVSSEPAT